jgi:hypothetical protein
MNSGLEAEQFESRSGLLDRIPSIAVTGCPIEWTSIPPIRSSKYLDVCWLWFSKTLSL